MVALLLLESATGEALRRWLSLRRRQAEAPEVGLSGEQDDSTDRR
jgi:hypothetical protein